MGRRRGSSYLSDNVHESSPLVPINDIEESDDGDGIRGGKRRLPVWLLILGAYCTLAAVYTAAYFASPPKDKWKEHLEECPAQGEYCKLLGGLSYVIQVTLAGTCAVVLLMAWLLESPRRPFIRFVADNSKSVIAATMTHFLAAGSAILIHNITEREDAVEDCDWYLIIFVWDSCIGVSLTLIFHQWTAHKFRSMPVLEFLGRIGDYESRPDPLTRHREPSTSAQRVQRWGYQVLHWLICAFVARVIDFAILYALAQELARVAAGLGWWACSKEQVQAKQWLNILVLPILLDSIQFLVQNHFLKNRELLTEQEDATAEASGDDSGCETVYGT
mmetsp:Transcript_27357/g.71717  ORF Transcript_27357/g.71717 Transcript_27357/m.71717 type:complete len:332 (-) Transcript_27357:271-1266(-)|eukprot:CAMPEP_0182927186 /NCGR_PEP_ID=MMETSP0105_2-20130417/13443_1 /TAXON_ID=81532 ORGANISM="Acanthoeca-like sp., Strain 10tr" /NCGR_SAMPLE_ID=MMETSP0105_2 /ASSEMBLY_ACC=CAM_ASM_000205 /LENGTH=331 /DNA_ID=CAMNT_0025065117 /DNA_START=215 /DNA_END=1210 /DNA_ORIENTATION=+